MGIIREMLIGLGVQRSWTLEGGRVEIQADICPSTLRNSQDGSDHGDRQILKALLAAAVGGLATPLPWWEPGSTPERDRSVRGALPGSPWQKVTRRAHRHGELSF